MTTQMMTSSTGDTDTPIAVDVTATHHQQQQQQQQQQQESFEMETIRQSSITSVARLPALKNELPSWLDPINVLNIDEDLSKLSHVTLSAEDVEMLSQQIQLRMQQIQLQMLQLALRQQQLHAAHMQLKLHHHHHHHQSCAGTHQQTTSHVQEHQQPASALGVVDSQPAGIRAAVSRTPTSDSDFTLPADITASRADTDNDADCSQFVDSGATWRTLRQHQTAATCFTPTSIFSPANSDLLHMSRRFSAASDCSATALSSTPLPSHGPPITSFGADINDVTAVSPPFCFSDRLSGRDASKPAAEYFHNQGHVGLEEMERFARTFKRRRIALGFTQCDVGLTMGKLYGNDFSQTTISRFEALNLSFKNMCKLKPLLEKWLYDVDCPDGRVPSVAVELAGRTATRRIHEQTAAAAAVGDVDSVASRRRKKRTNIDQLLRQALETLFAASPKPSAEQISEMARRLGMDRDVVQVWFCNRRQKEKRVHPG